MFPFPRGWLDRRPPTTQFTINRNSPQAKGLVARWVSIPYGSTIWDQSDYAQHGTLFGDASVVVTQMGMSYTFDGIGDYGEIIKSNLLDDATKPYTISAWCLASSTSAGAHNIFSSGATAGSGYSIQIRRNGSDWEFYQAVPPDIGVIYTGGVISNQWTHVVGSWSIPTLSLYIDGISRGTPQSVNTRFRADNYHYIGADGNDYVTPSQLWDGHIRDIRIYNRSLTPPEIYQHYAPETCYDLYQPLAPPRFWSIPEEAGGVIPRIPAMYSDHAFI